MRFVIPVTMVGTHEKVATTNMTSQGRQKREVGPGQRAPSWDLTDDKHTWIDAIGVPRGVPNKYKLADNVAAGFESFPVWSALFPVTPIKNVDRINYVHYNVQKLANLTRDAVEGLSEQLAAHLAYGVSKSAGSGHVTGGEGGCVLDVRRPMLYLYPK